MKTTNKKEALLVFMPSGKRDRFALSTPILDAARSLGVDIDSVCGGRGVCGRCQVEVTVGNFAKHGISSTKDSISPVTDSEEKFHNEHGMTDERRLCCQAKLLGDLVIDVPASSQVHHQVVRKPFEAHDILIDPVVHAYAVEVAEPQLKDARSDFQLLLSALEKDWQLSSLSCELSVIQELQSSLKTGKRTVTVAVRKNNTIVAIWPGIKQGLFGIAIDVGSTTIATQLCDLSSGELLATAGKMNPQIRYGEDLMSRISYIMMNEGGEEILISTVRNAINELIKDVCKQANININDILELTIVGNPVMQHLFLGINPVELGAAPFALALDCAIETQAKALDININPGGYVYVLPCIAGHVGADAAAVLLAEAPYERDELSLIVDVGTNAELILGNRQRILAASSPTGPAFEGAQISSGQRAAPGAIERVRIDRETLQAKFKVIGCDLWSDDKAFEANTKKIGISGICGSGIIEAIAEMYLSGIINTDGKINPEEKLTSPHIFKEGRVFTYRLHQGEPDITIRQNDVRAIQLAKAALYAGARCLMEKFGVDQVDRIRLAGAFGSHIDVKYAMVLGLIPDCELSSVSCAGNAAGTGARIALLNQSSREVVESEVSKIEKIETATEDKFQEHFVAAMAIPHQKDKFTNLAREVDLPVNTRETLNRKKQRRRNNNNHIR
ncbi:MAG: DUF4445 domain-containing protein [Gammaproteobacteria bacterium]|nr:DUF4445 domain-containing protein [Gammaproteobacteria bacterium]